MEGPETIMGGGAGMCPRDLILCRAPPWTISSLMERFRDLLWCEFLVELSST